MNDNYLREQEEEFFDFPMIILNEKNIIEKKIKPLIKTNYKNRLIDGEDLYKYCSNLYHKIEKKQYSKDEKISILFMGLPMKIVKEISIQYPSIINSKVIQNISYINLFYINTFSYYNKKRENIIINLKNNKFLKEVYTIFLYKKMQYLYNNLTDLNIIELELVLFEMNFLNKYIDKNKEFITLYNKCYNIIYKGKNLEIIFENYKKKYNITKVTYYEHNDTLYIENNLEEWFVRINTNKGKIQLFHINEKQGKGFHRQAFDLQVLDFNELFFYIYLHHKNKINREYNKINTMFTYIK